jgi:hypothetical protein
MINKVIVSLTILTLIWGFTILPAHAEENLYFALVGYQTVHIKTFEPFNLWFEVVNPDSIGHSYRILVYFQGYMLSENGYISEDSMEIIHMTIVPLSSGNDEILARLYQDGSGDAYWVDEKSGNVTVEKSNILTQLENLNDQIEGLETYNLMLNDVANKLTLATVSLFVIILVLVLTLWRFHKDLRDLEKRNKHTCTSSERNVKVS